MTYLSIGKKGRCKTTAKIGYECWKRFWKHLLLCFVLYVICLGIISSCHGSNSILTLVEMLSLSRYIQTVSNELLRNKIVISFFVGKMQISLIDSFQRSYSVQARCTRYHFVLVGSPREIFHATDMEGKIKKIQIRVYFCLHNFYSPTWPNTANFYYAIAGM